MPIKHQYKWQEHNITIASYIPMEVYDALVAEANQKGAALGSYISLSQLVRDILAAHVEGVKA